MFSFLKKSSSLILIVSSLAIASTTAFSLPEVNEKLAKIFKVYNSPNSSMKMTFTSLEIDATRALKFGFNFFMAKKTDYNKLTFKINNASYDYAQGNPYTDIDMSLDFDLIKALGQDFINEMSEVLEPLVADMISQYGQNYGQALQVNVALTELKKDAGGNVISAKLALNLSLDYSLLPQDVKASDVEIKSLNAVLAADRKNISARIQVVMNPEYKNFDKEQVGLKEVIENILNDDQRTYDELQDMIKIFDGFADSLLTMTAQ